MKKLVNIPDELFNTIKDNAVKFGWSVQSEIVDMLYFCIISRTNFVNSKRNVVKRDIFNVSFDDWSSDTENFKKVTRMLLDQRK